MAARTAILLEQLGLGSRKPQRREQLQALRRRLDDSCKARFTLGLQEELLTPLQTLCSSPDSRAIQDLETAARGLRTLGLEARVVGSGATDQVLEPATGELLDEERFAAGYCPSSSRCARRSATPTPTALSTAT